MHKEFSNINQAAFLLGFFAILSQILGLFRDRSLAHFLGPSQDLDIYYSAFRIPDFIFISIASLASFTVLIPFLAEKLKNDDSAQKARIFLNNVFSVFLIMIVLASLLAYMLMPHLSRLIAPGFSPEMLSKLSTLSRIMLLSPIFLGLSNLLGTVTQIYNKFFIYAISPILYNFGILLGVLVFYPLWHSYGLVIGVILGALLHLAIQIPVIIRHDFVPRFSFKVDFNQIKDVVILSFPRTIGLAVNNLSLIAILAMASFQKEGAISIFNLALNLQMVPVTIIGASYSVAAFPSLARFFAAGEKDKFIDQIAGAGRQIIFWSMPAIFLFFVLRAQIVRVILGSGRFSWADTRLTAAALALFSISILAQSLILLLVRGYYAAGRTKRPLIVNVIFSSLTILFAYFLSWLFVRAPEFRFFIESFLRVEDIQGTSILMFPLAYSVGTILNFFGLWFLFRRDFLDHKITYLRQTFFQSLWASFFIGFTAYYFLGVFDDFLNINTFFGILGQGLFSGILGILAGVVILWLLKNGELSDAWQTFRMKFWKKKVVAESLEQL